MSDRPWVNHGLPSGMCNLHKCSSGLKPVVEVARRPGHFQAPESPGELHDVSLLRPVFKLKQLSRRLDESKDVPSWAASLF
jgi:hypothetical protein